VTDRIRRRTAVLLWACALAAVGGAGAAAGRERKPVTHTVTIEATRYQPARLTIRAGDTVVWVNKDYIPHTVTAAGGRFDSQILAAGASWRHTLKAKGAFAYACAFHPTMTGTVDVE
jgi:plastocyanin